MKQSEIITIALVATMGTLTAAFTLNAVLGDPNMRTETIKVVEPITSELIEPDEEIFNADAINPTIEVYVGSCEDVDQNGILDQAELVACGQASDATEDVLEDQTNPVNAAQPGTVNTNQPGNNAREQ